MATGRIIKTAISVSEQVNDLSTPAALLFTWMIPHADDFGRMSGSAKKLKALVVPMRDDMPAGVVDNCLKEMQKAGLIIRYVVAGDMYLQFPKWDEHQSGLHKRTKSKWPGLDAEGAQILDASGGFREIPGNSSLTRAPGTEQNRTEQNNQPVNAHEAEPETTDAEQTPADDLNDEEAPRVPRVGVSGDGDRFPMFATWKPSEHMAGVFFRAGLPYSQGDIDLATADLITHWLTQPGERRNQAEWDKALLQSAKFAYERRRQVPATTTATQPRKVVQAPTSRHNGLSEQDFSTDGMTEDDEIGGFRLGQR